jgi:hypothetical protein
MNIMFTYRKHQLRVTAIMLFSIFFTGAVQAATYYLTTLGANNPHLPANWNTGGTGGGGTAAPNFTTAGDVFIIAATMNAGGFRDNTFGTNVTLIIDGTCEVDNGKFLAINGTISLTAAGSLQVDTRSTGDFILNAGATLITKNTNGIIGPLASISALNRDALLSTAANYEFNGTAVQAITGLPATVNNLTANNPAGLTINSSVTVNGTFLVTNSGVVNVNGGTTVLGTNASMIIDPLATFQVSIGGTASLGARPVTIRSAAAGTGRIGTITGTFNTATNVTMERFIKLRAGGTGRAYRLLAPTVNTTGSIRANWMEGVNKTIVGVNVDPNPGYGTQISGPGGAANGFDVTLTNQASLFGITNGTVPTYTAFGSTGAALNALTGYFLFIRGDRAQNMTIPSAPGMPTSSTTLRTTGTLLTGTQTVFTNAFTGGGALNLVTNPYASPIDWSLVRAASTNITDFYTLWDPNVGSRGGFVTVNSAGVASAGLATRFIQPGQAFFVQSSGGVPAVSIQESHKAAGNNNEVFRFPPPPVESFGVALYFTEPDGFRRMADGIKVLFDNRYSPLVDNNDALEINNWDENIAIARDGKNLSIEGRPVIKKADNLPIFMNNMKPGKYEFECTPTAFSNTGLNALLLDNFTGNRTHLSVTQSVIVPFAVTANPASSAANRFSIVFGQNSPVLRETVPGAIFPNPVTGNSFLLNLSNLDKGMYTVELVNALAGKVYTTRLQHPGGPIRQNIEPGAGFEKGAYHLVLHNEAGVSINLGLIKQ